ncbi:MAG: thiamine phosphate synthase [Candidatus Altiarchaeales archaeon]|nr:thiamine phosphate synthase [Candidatus Altiarchaeales archaeon]
MKLRGFYFITDSKLSRKTNVEDVKSAVKGGAKIVQYREKGKNLADFLIEAFELKKICNGKGVLFLINDSVSACLLTDADGVHLGQEDMPLETARNILGKEKVIGVTAHNVEEAVESERNGTDYLGLSPIFHTNTKLDAGPAAGLQLIRDVKKKVKIPCAAIGGINESNVDSVIQTGADMVSAISATVAKDSVEKAVKFFADKFGKTE